MRVLIIHNHYQDPGGEDAVFEQEHTLLSLTEEVALLTFQNRKGWKGAWQTLWSPWNVRAGRKVKRAIREHRPDVIHIHNLHYAIGPIAIRIAKRQGIPVVMTLHNYRLLCPSATLFYNGNLFTDSLHTRFPWQAVRLGLHSHSVFKTFWLAFTVWLHKKMGTWQMVDRYIPLTAFAKQLFVDSTFGVPKEKFVVKPNFVSPPKRVKETRGQHFLFVGRLTPEKGIDVLLEAFGNTDKQLRIAGDGPMREKVVATCQKHPNMVYLGSLDKTGIDEQLASCTALVFPSIWFEGMPMTILEAFAAGTPVIASHLGAMQAMVKDGENGLLFPAGNVMGLQSCVEQFSSMAEVRKREMRKRARLEYERHYKAEENKLLLLAIYQSACRVFVSPCKS